MNNNLSFPLKQMCLKIAMSVVCRTRLNVTMKYEWRGRVELVVM